MTPFPPPPGPFRDLPAAYTRPSQEFTDPATAPEGVRTSSPSVLPAVGEPVGTRHGPGQVYGFMVLEAGDLRVCVCFPSTPWPHSFCVLPPEELERPGASTIPA